MYMLKEEKRVLEKIRRKLDKKIKEDFNLISHSEKPQMKMILVGNRLEEHYYKINLVTDRLMEIEKQLMQDRK